MTTEFASADIGTMLESVAINRVTGPRADLYSVEWVDLHGRHLRFDDLIDHDEIRSLCSMQRRVKAEGTYEHFSDDPHITALLQPIFTAAAEQGGRICAMVYLKIDDDGELVARIKRVPIVGSAGEPFECKGGVPISGPDVYPLPIRSRA